MFYSANGKSPQLSPTARIAQEAPDWSVRYS